MNRIILTKESVDYQISHTAPTKNEYQHESAGIGYDIENYMPDIYSNNALQYYGEEDDTEDLKVIRVIQSMKDNPNKKVTIYRSIPIPDDYKEIKLRKKQINNKIKKLSNLISYHKKYNFFPINDPTINSISTKIKNKNLSYDEKQKEIIKIINNLIDELNKQYLKTESDLKTYKKNNISKLNINKGDWVTFSKKYAKIHGESIHKNNYLIVKKTVPSKHLYFDGNSIYEWGYDPS